MEKEIVEKLVERHTGLKLGLSHKGNHRWESEKVATTKKNSGVFHSFFDTIHVDVFANAVDANDANDGWFFLRLSLNWSHRNGGTNGASVDLFYYKPNDELLTREAACERWKRLASVGKIRL